MSLAVHALLLGLLVALPARVERNPDDRTQVDVVFYRGASPAEQAEVPAAVSVEPNEVLRIVTPDAPAFPSAPVPSTPKPADMREEPARPVRFEPPGDAAPAIVARQGATSTLGLPAADVHENSFENTGPAPVATTPSARKARMGLFADATEARPPTGGDFSIPARAKVGAFAAASESSEGNRPGSSGPPGRAVAMAAFGGTVPSGEAPLRRGGRARAVERGKFGEVVAVTEPKRSRPPVPEDPDTPVEIVSKPKPIYTEEARRLRVEGEVVLRVVFNASGRLRVLGILKGLGHGLDEAAVEAAQKIHFKPANRDGRPVDHTAVLRVLFQLA